MVTESEIQADPVLDFNYIIADLGVSRPTFFRHVRPTLDVMQVSPGRLGVLASTYRAWKAARVRPAQRVALTCRPKANAARPGRRSDAHGWRNRREY